MGTILNTIIKYKNIIFIAILLIFVAVFINERQELSNTKQQLQTAKQISTQNLAALSDNSIQLEVTKNQLSIIDSNLRIALDKVDSLGKIKTKVITIAQPIYTDKDIIVPSSLKFDTSKDMYGLSFTSTDMVRTINGVSTFKIEKNETNTLIIPGSTSINDFKLNFTFVISQYDDTKTKFTRTKIIPFNVKPDGSLGDQIPDSLLKVQFRNAEILDKPFTLPTDQVVTKKKFTIKSGWGLTINPFAAGFYPSGNGIKLGWTPNIGVGYCITFK